MKKRIISIIAVLSVMITLLVPHSAVHAELGIKNELQVSLMAALNIVPGYPASYNAEANVSAKDFFKYAYRLIGMEILDLSSEIKSYGLDEDSETIPSSAAVKAVIDIIGYDKIVDMYNNDYSYMASKLGMLNGTDMYAGSEECVTYDQMVMLFWNTLNMNAMKMESVDSYGYSDKTIMEYYLKIYEESGIVNANNTIAVDGGKTTGTDEVRIGNESYLVGNTITEQLIGSSVKFYYYDSDEKVLKWIERNSSKTKTVLLYGDNITSVGDSIVAYDEGGKNKTLRLDPNYLIIYNGKTVTDGSIGLEAVMSLNSQSYFISNSGGKYNIVIIKDYEYYLVDAISQSHTVNDYSAKTSIDLDDAETLKVYENGVRTTADAIKAGNVIAVTKSADGKVITAEILSGTVSGEITSIASNEIKVAGARYTVSPSYAGDALKIGRSGTFYFDNYGRVVRCVKLKEASSQYGYLLNFYRGESPDSDCFAEILTAQGTRETFTVKQSVNVNGEKCTLDAALQRVSKNQLVTYKVNSSNALTKINTASTAYIGRDTSAEFLSVHFKGAGKYRKNNMCFNSKYLLDSTTPIFVIPYNGDKEDYTVMDASSLVNNTTYDISVYDIDDYMYASCIVLKENFAEPENLRSKRSVILTDVMRGINDDDEDIITLEGYQQGGKVSYTVENTEMRDNRGRYYVRDLGEGDVVQLGVDVKGVVSAVQLLFKADEEYLPIAAGTDTPNSYWEGGTVVMPDLWVSFGEVTDRNTNVLLVDADGNDAIINKAPHKFATATNVYVYENGKLSPTNKNDIFDGDLVYVQEYQGNLHEVVVIR